MTDADIGLTATALVAQALKEVGIPSPGVTQGALVYAGYQLASGHHASGALIIVADLPRVAVRRTRGLLVRPVSWRGADAGRTGRYLRLSARDLERAKARLGRGTLWAVTVGRMIPAIMAPLSLVAGMMRVRVTAFAAGVSLSTLAWAGLLAGRGRRWRRRVRSLLASSQLAASSPPSRSPPSSQAAVAILWWRSARNAERGEFDAR